MKNNSFFKSLFHAIEGIISAIRTERNLRFHIVIANLICIFSYFYGISKESWAVLILTIFSVIAAELLNTSIENAIDTITDDIKLSAKIAKDTSAAAVLVLAIGSILVGISLFGDLEKITYTLAKIFTDIKNLIPCAIIGILDVWFLLGFKEKRIEDENEK